MVDMLVNQSEFARLSGVSRQSVAKCVKSGDIHKRPNGKIDTNHPINKEYMERDRSDKDTSPEKQLPGKAPVSKAQQTPQEAPHDEIKEEDLLNPSNVNVTTKDALAKLKTIRQIRDLELNNQIKRERLIDRNLIRAVLSKKYEIDMASYLTIKDKLMPDLAAIFEVNDPEKVLEAGERMDDELWKILNHTKALFDKFLIGIKSEEI